MRMLAMPFTQDCTALLIDLTTGHYNSAGMHSSTSLWLALSRQHTWESSTTRLRSTQQHKYALPWLPEIYWNERLYI